MHGMLILFDCLTCSAYHCSIVLVFVQILLSIFAVLSSTIVIRFDFIGLMNDADALQGMLVDCLRCISDTFVRSRCISFECWPAIP
jgi:hypothetical protein